ncbi:hypothetical protein [Chitinophaga sp.]|uniref:hypothetical protein n=1 Tax=Chitinophaga sp. TaxID=1869181 RepID=UPI00263983BD|nr:hypothetical protein [uncultured Chitinophaga sp.]
MQAYELTASEMALAADAEIILTKNRVIGKVYALFGALQTAMEADAVIGRYGAGESDPPKISRGEQYEGLPYVMLDYPRAFGRESIFACRTFFWWGRFFSLTLHLAGGALERHRGALTGMHERVASAGWYVCVNDDPWQHHFREDNYRAAASVSQTEWEELLRKPFFKLAKQCKLRDWEKIMPVAAASYASLLGWLGGSSVR